LLTATERLLLYLVSFVLLAVGLGVLVSALVRAVTDRASWTETFIGVLEEMLLVLIIVEIFITVRAHLHGRRLQLEPFIVVGIIAVVRHILSTVVRLSVPETPAQSHDRLTELAVDAGTAFLLVAALALAQWSQRRSSGEPPGMRQVPRGMPEAGGVQAHGEGRRGDGGGPGRP
jgi:uncharacterized membrane protein (DUF373 family)